MTTVQHNTDKIKSTSVGKSVASVDLGASVFSLNEDDNREDDADDDT